MTSPRSRIAPSVADAIGDTPLVALDRLTQGRKGRIYAKLDYLNPGGSKKDRAAREILRAAEKRGDISHGQTIVEMTSGNMGAGAAIVCAARGYRFVAVMSRGNSQERARMMRALGAEVVLVDQAPGAKPGEVSGADLDLVDREAKRLCAERDAFRIDQFNRVENRNAYEYGAAPEIWMQTAGCFDAFCDIAGSGGTYAGCARYFKRMNPDIACYIIEPEGAETLAGGATDHPHHPIQGAGYAMALPLLAGAPVDGFIAVSGEDAREYARLLARREGIFAGFSSGANVAAAIKLLETSHKGGAVVIVLNDSGLKYLSTDLWPD